MKLIDYMVQRTGETEECIMYFDCPSSYGPQFGKYERGCGSCRECWEQEMEETEELPDPYRPERRDNHDGE